KKPEFEGKKPQSEVHVSPSSSAQTKKHDDKTKREAKGKSPHKHFSAAGPSNTVVSPTHGKSSCIDTSQYPDDPNMPELEDITYSDDDEEDVGAEADFTNLETPITVSRIPTTRVHKDHHVTQIIGDLSSATQTRSMTRVAKDQGGLSQINNDDFHTCLQVKQKKYGIFISQDKYVTEILRKFGLKNGKSASTPIDAKKPLLKDPDVKDVDVHTYISMIGSLMYLTSSRPDIMFAAALSSMKALKRMLHVTNILNQTVSGKESSNLLMADNLPKIIWYSTHHVALMKSWLVQSQAARGQTATGKEISNPFMAEGIDCLPNEEIFTDLARMGYEKPSTKLTFYKAFFSIQWKFLIHNIPQCMSAKRTSWNEFSSSMASAVICISSGRKFNFSKYIFDSLVRNVDSLTKFYMYPRFLQLMIRAQVSDLSSDTTKYSSPVLTHKVFANMRRVGKGCSGVETSLFEGMIVAPQAGKGAAEVNVDNVSTIGVADEGAASIVDDVVPAAVDAPSIPSPTPPTQTPPPSQDIPSTSQVQPTPPPSLISQPPSPQQQPQPLQDAAISIDLLHNLLDTYQRVERSDDTVMDGVSKQGRIIADMDADVDVNLKDVVVDAETEESDDKVDLTKLQEVVEVVITAKLMTEVVTTASSTITVAALQLTTVAAPTLTTDPSAARRRKGVVIRDPEETATPTPSTIIHTEPKSKDKGKGILVEEPKPLKKKAQIEMTYDDMRPIFEKKFNSNVAFLHKTKERMEEEDSKALKRISESQKDKAAKEQKLDEEVEELKRHLQIVPNDEDDVYTEAIPLARKNSSWFSKGQKLETVRVMWSAHYHIYLYTDDLASREKIPTYNVHSGSNAQQFEESLNVTFDETPPPPKTSHLEDDDLVEEQAIDQTALAISTTKSEYVSAKKACQQALWMKEALIDYGIDFKEYTLKDYYCWLKTCCCWYKLKLLVDAADSRLRLLEESAVVDDKMKK
nr:hypothetical protein [Tanacetum cinerariifolium]